MVAGGGGHAHDAEGAEPASGTGLPGLPAQWFGRTTILVQYWRDFDSLDRFARDRDLPHLEAWRRFNRAVRASGDVGIWHETFRVRAGEYEAVYGNMPVFGLAAAATHLPATRKGNTAAARIGASTTDEPAESRRTDPLPRERRSPRTSQPCARTNVVALRTLPPFCTLVWREPAHRAARERLICLGQVRSGFALCRLAPPRSCVPGALVRIGVPLGP